MEKAIIEHSKEMKDRYGSFGNGYISFPVSTPMYRYQSLEPDWYNSWNWPKGYSFSEEITYYKVDGNNVVIGFDTLRTWSNESHNEKWIDDKLNELIQVVSSYTSENLSMDKISAIHCFVSRIALI